MPVDEKKTCNMHTSEKEKSGTCCQTKDEQENAEQQTYEHSVFKTKGPNYASSEWYLGKHNNEIGIMRQKQRSQDE